MVRDDRLFSAADSYPVVTLNLTVLVSRASTADFPVPEELTQRFRRDPRFKRAFNALTPGRQRSYLYHFAAAKQSATRAARIERAMPAIFEGRGFLERG
jgi:uncharacterized protein YdeI (YjbR/CyaY-like superfamily)